MPFDGVEWSAPMFVYPRSYQPHTPFTADVLQASLINAYYAARHNGVLVLSQAYERNDTGAFDGNASWVLNTDTAGNISSGYVYVSPEWTHARAFIVFECVTMADTEVTHRISAFDGSGTTNGTSIEQPVTRNFDDDIASALRVSGEIDNAPGGLFFAQCEVSLGGFLLDEDLLFTVQGHAADVVFANFASYRPVHVAVFLECRE